MAASLRIEPLEHRDIPVVVNWARQEGFAPGQGDVAIYRHTDRQGLWLGWLGTEPVGCIAAVRYNASYGFLGLFLVAPPYRGQGHGLALWRHALNQLKDLACIGLEAAPSRIHDYRRWGFQAASPTTRWHYHGQGERPAAAAPLAGLHLVAGRAVPQAAVQAFDAEREPSPRPHFLRQWLRHPAGDVLALMDGQGHCRGFARIRPCLLREGEGWRIGPLLADSVSTATELLAALIQRHPGVVLIDAPGANSKAGPLLQTLGFSPAASTLRMYRGCAPAVSMADVYGLACLELG